MDALDSRTVLLMVVVLLSAMVGGTAITAASSSYDVSVPGAIDVPDRVLEVGDEEIEITSVARVAPGEDIEASTTAPDGESYILYQYDSDGDRYDFSRMTGDDSTTFSTDDSDPGTYILALRADRDYQATQPVVIAAYDGDLHLPDEAEPGTTVNATVELEAYDTEPPIDGVELLLMDGDNTDPVEVTQTDDGVYETTLELPDTEGTYNVFATVLGTESLAYTTEQEMLEITETSISVSESTADDDSDDADDTDDTDDETGDADDGSGDSDSSDDADETDSADAADDTDGVDDADDANDTDDTDDIDDADAVNETDDTDTADADDADGDTDDGDNTADGEDTTDSSDDDGLITPNDTSDDDVSSGEAPLTGFPQFIGALLLISLIARHRRRQRE